MKKRKLKPITNIIEFREDSRQVLKVLSESLKKLEEVSTLTDKMKEKQEVLKESYKKLKNKREGIK